MARIEALQSIESLQAEADRLSSVSAEHGKNALICIGTLAVASLVSRLGEQALRSNPDAPLAQKVVAHSAKWGGRAVAGLSVLQGIPHVFGFSITDSELARVNNELEVAKLS